MLTENINISHRICYHRLYIYLSIFNLVKINNLISKYWFGYLVLRHTLWRINLNWWVFGQQFIFVKNISSLIGRLGTQVFTCFFELFRVGFHVLGTDWVLEISKTPKNQSISSYSMHHLEDPKILHKTY